MTLCVYKEYKLKIKMVYTGVMTKKMRFLLGYK